jgi:methylphosphotriester-DNA--protein-cysteine methyltransferase
MALRGKAYTLIGAAGNPYASAEMGTIGGHRRSKIFGRLDCPAALRAIARGGYLGYRVFFADIPTAIQAGYRPCGVCMPDAHRAWRVAQSVRVRTNIRRSTGTPGP